MYFGKAICDLREDRYLGTLWLDYNEVFNGEWSFVAVERLKIIFVCDSVHLGSEHLQSTGCQNLSIFE